MLEFIDATPAEWPTPTKHVGAKNGKEGRMSLARHLEVHFRHVLAA